MAEPRQNIWLCIERTRHPEQHEQRMKASAYPFSASAYSEGSIKRFFGQSPQNDNMQKAAFTLAEVLITLAIIGIVAAMTIPTLVSSYKEKALQTQLKKTYSILVNAIALSEIDNGSVEKWPIGAEMSDVNAYFAEYWQPYFKGAELCNSLKDGCGYGNIDNKTWTNDRLNWSVKTDESRILFRIADGTVFFIPRNTNDANNNNAPIYTTVMYIDINGSRGPNKGGVDVFKLSRNSDGIRPYNSNTCIETNSAGCLKKIMENGWEFPDDYPFKF